MSVKPLPSPSALSREQIPERADPISDVISAKSPQRKVDDRFVPKRLQAFGRDQNQESATFIPELVDPLTRPDSKPPHNFRRSKMRNKMRIRHVRMVPGSTS